jgi:hypothetical protein
MSEEKKILDKLNEHKIRAVGNIVRDTGEQNKFYAFIEIERKKEGKKIPSNYKLKKIAEDFEQDDIHLSFVSIEDGIKNTQETFKSILFQFFSQEVRNGFLESESNGIIFWVEPKKILLQKEIEAIDSKIQEICIALGLKLNVVKFTSSENLPTPTACLSIIKRKAPLTLGELNTELKLQKLFVPSDAWLSKIVDKLRKSQRILWRKDGTYVLTLNGLSALGSSKNQKSSDVIRALDLPRRVT